VAAVAWIAWQATRPTSLGVVMIDPNTPLPEAEGYLLGDPNAPVQVLEFADFECPACGSFTTLTEPDVRKRLVETGQISFRFLDFPLSMHRNSWDASMAAACANEQGKFWEMHDQIFANQDRWATQVTNRPRAVFTPLAQSIGLDMAKWNQCYDEQRYKQQIAANLREGERRRVGSTPTFVIGSRMIGDAMGWDEFKAYVDSALAEAPARPAPADSGTR
jgi:protein-disulfide isomerase